MSKEGAPGAGLIARLLDWSPEGRINGRDILAALAGVSALILLGVALGRPSLGLSVGLGALFLSGSADAGETGRWRAAASGLVLAILAVGAALVVTASPAPALAMIGLASVAALFSGYSRAVGAAAIRAVIYLVLCVTLLEAAGAHRTEVGVIFVVGAVWNILVRSVMTTREARPDADSGVRKPTAAQIRTHWRRSLSTWAGWQFPLRMAAGLALACGLRDLWPERHFSWIILTIALLTQRPVERFPIKILQRTVGTVLGVGLAWLLLRDRLAPDAATSLIAGLATIAVLARLRSYLLYAIISTPVILAVMDFGQAVDPGLLTDRLIATLVGAVIVLSGNQIAARLPAPATPSGGRPRAP